MKMIMAMNWMPWCKKQKKRLIKNKNRRLSLQKKRKLSFRIWSLVNNNNNKKLKKQYLIAVVKIKAMNRKQLRMEMKLIMYCNNYFHSA